MSNIIPPADTIPAMTEADLKACELRARKQNDLAFLRVITELRRAWKRVEELEASKGSNQTLGRFWERSKG